MDMLTIISKLDTLTPERRKKLAERWQGNTLTTEDREELKTHVAMAVAKREEQQLVNTIVREETGKKP